MEMVHDVETHEWCHTDHQPACPECWAEWGRVVCHTGDCATEACVVDEIGNL